MAKYAMVIDLDTCTGCNACMAACATANQTPVWADKWRTHVHDEALEKDGRWVRQFFPRLCNQCDNPPCVAACPTGATWKDAATGIVRVDPEICMGCQACALACPYDARYGADRHDIAEGERFYGKDELKRTVPSVDKCDFCYDRLQEGLQPACVETCVGHARIFGDLEDPNSEVSRIVATGKAKGLLPELGTGPNVYYVAKYPEEARK
jgi:sulfur reductase FeS subunit